MKKTVAIVLCLAVLAFGVSVHAASLTAGNLVICRVGDGVNALANTGNPVFLDEYTTNGTLVQSVAMPTNQVGGNYPVIAAGGTTAEGGLTLSTDGLYLFLTGYATNSISGDLLVSSSTNVPRVVARVDAGGNIDTTTVLTNFADLGSPRSATSSDGTNIWVGGSTGGVRYTTLGSTLSNSTQLTNQVTNIRRVNIFNDTNGIKQLFFSDASGATFRLATAGPGLPTTSGQIYTNLPGFRTFGGPYDFVFLNLQGSGAGPDTVYVTDDNSALPAPVAGIEKWSLVSGSWVSNGVIPLAACRGLTARTVSGSNVLLYATASYSGAGLIAATNIFGITDTSGYNAAPVWSTNFIAGVQSTNEAFRGIAFTPLVPQINSWTDGSSKWETGGNWSSGAAPSAFDLADLITNAGNNTVTIDAATANAPNTMTISKLTICANTLQLTGAITTTFQVLNQLALSNEATLLITNANASLSSAGAALGAGTSSSNNVAVVAGANTVWSNGTVVVGSNAPSNRLTLFGGAKLLSTTGTIGTGSAASNDVVILSDPGSVWSNMVTLVIGGSVNNRLVISNGAALYTGGIFHNNNSISRSNFFDLGGLGAVSSVTITGFLRIGNTVGATYGFLTVTNAIVSSGRFDLGGPASGGSSNNVANVLAGSSWNLNASRLAVLSDAGTMTIDAGMVTNVGDILWGTSVSTRGSTLIITNGGKLFSGVAGTTWDIGSGPGGDVATITGPASTWNAGGRTVNIGDLFSNNMLSVTSGGVFTNGSLIVGNSASNNTLIINGGKLALNNLSVTSSNSITFSAGTLETAGATVDAGANGGAILPVGDGVNATTYRLLGGIHSFNSNLRVGNNATLSGCGTVTGNVVVDTGGSVQADCGSTFVFTGIVTNNGTISAIAGTTVSFSALMVNNGAIVATNGSVQFNGGVVNNGAMLTNSPTSNSWIDGNGKWETGSNWSLGNAPSSFDSADLITNAGNSTVTIDAATTNSPSTMTISNLTVSAPPGSTNSLVLENSGTAVPLQVLSNFTADGNASIVVSNGALVATNAGVSFSIGYAGVGNQMAILAGGKVQAAVGHVGFTNTSSGNLVLVSDAGSVWTNQSFLDVGHDGWNNRLVISNGGAVYDLDGVVGFSNTSSNNAALVTGVGSVWSNLNNLYVGNSGAGNVLVINNGGVVSAGGYGIIGLSNNNNAEVSGTGSVFSSQSTFNYLGGDYALQVGRFGSGNSLIVSNGGLVLNTANIGDAGIGTGSGANSNRVVVADSGSVWSNANNNGILIGWDGGNSDSLVVSNGGIVSLTHGSIALGGGGDDNSIVVTDPGSALNLYYQITLAVNGNHHGNTLIINNGAVLVSSFGVGSQPAYIGSGNSSSTSNSVFVTGSSSVWSNRSPIIFGELGSRSNTMVVSSGGLVVSGLDGNPSAIGHSGNNNSVLVTGSGSTWNNPSELDLGSNGGSGNSLAIDGGAFVTASNLVVYPGNSLSLNGGTMTTTDGLTISNDATLAGCGTITGSVRVDGTVQANCGSTLNFTGIVTNNGVLTATAGTVLRLYGPVVNNGVIDVTHGGATFFSTLSGSGTVLFSPTNSWISGDGKWETATNWSSGITPSLADSADFITNAGNKTVTIDAITSGGFPSTLSISNLTISAPLNMTNTLLLSDAGTNTPLAVLDTVRVGSGGAMFITNSALKVSGPKGGTVNVDGLLTLVDDGTILVSSNLLVGALDPLGSVNILGGALYVTNASHNAVTEVRYGTVMLTNGLFATDSLLITNPGANFFNNGGTFTITGVSQVDQGTQTVASGTTEISSNLLIGSSADSTGTVNVAGGQLVATNASITIGDLGVGNMNVSNASVSTISVDIGAGTNSQGTLTLQDDSDVTISSNLTAGSASGATGTVNMAGGSMTITNGTLGIGNDGTVSSGSGTGFMTVSNNATLTASTILLGSSAGGQGEMTLDDGGVIQGSGTNPVIICNGFTQIGGDLSWTNIGSAIYCGYTHPGAFALSNGTSSCQDMFVGYDNTGTMTVAGGVMNILSRLIVGQLGSPLSSGAVWITGGQLTMASFTIIGNSGIGQMVISNGIVTMTDVFVGNGSNPGTLTLAGGTLTVNNIVVPNPNSRFIFTAGCLNARTISNANGRVVTLGDGINPATFNLLGGTSSLDQGLTVSAGTRLSALGSISGSVMNSGLLMAPAGLLSISGAVTNFGTVLAAGGGTINFNGQVVNNGMIVTNKGVHFNAGMTNNGTLVDANGDPDHDGFNNLSEYEGGSNPNDTMSTPLQITSIVQQNNDVLVTWITAGGTTNFVQATTGGSGNYSNSFTDLSPVIVPPGNDLTSANYLDRGAATNFPARYYRVRFVP